MSSLPAKAFPVLKRAALIAAAVLLGAEALLWLTHFGALACRKYKEHGRAAQGTGTVRILALGESTTDTLIPPPGMLAWPEELEIILNKDRSFNTRFEVINKGLAGISSIYFAERINSMIRDYKPDLIIPMIGVNDYLPVSNTCIQDHWYYRSRLVRAFNWYRDFRLIEKDRKRKAINDRLNALYWPLFGKAEQFLKDPANHSEEKIIGFGQSLKNGLPADKAWLADDAMAYLLAKICFYGRTRQMFPELKDLLIKPHDFYTALARRFMLELYHARSTGLWAPSGFYYYPDSFMNREMKDYQQFLVDNLDSITNPISRNQAINSIGEPWISGKAVAGRYTLLNSGAQSYQRNYLYIIKAARDNGIPVFPMQYPRVPAGWLRAVVQGEEIRPGDGRIYCSPWRIVKPAEKINEDLVLISNEELGDACTPQNTDYFSDNFHYCQDDRYTFGHAGPLLNKLIAANAYKAIKGNRNRLFPR